MSVFAAIEGNDLEALRRELPQGASARNEQGVSALLFALYQRNDAARDALLAAGAEVDADDANPFRVRPLHSAASVRDHESVRALLEAGADPNIRQQGGYTALHSAAHNDDVELVRLLLAHGADPALAADDGQTAADMAGGATRELL